MVTVVEGLALLDEARQGRPSKRATGLAGLDEATGGLAEGQVWIVTGAPGDGRSAMMCQLAWVIAGQHGFDTELILQREPSSLMAARVASVIAKVPLAHLWRGNLTEVDREKLAAVATRIEQAPLSIRGPEEVSIADADLPGLSAAQALVVDDAHLTGGLFPERVARLAASGLLVVLSMPRHLVMSDSGLDSSWAAVADFVLDIDRPDLLDRNSLRPGEADLHLIRNRWGPTQSYVVAFQGHYSRFVDLH